MTEEEKLKVGYRDMDKFVSCSISKICLLKLTVFEIGFQDSGGDAVRKQ